MGTDSITVKDFGNAVIGRITSSGKDWKDFLKTMSHHLQRSFADLVMIFGQRPDASSCLSKEAWSEKHGRYVKSGAAAITLPDLDADIPAFRCVYDISDTVGAENTPHSFVMKPEYRDVIKEHFSQSYGFAADSLEEAIGRAVIAGSQEYWQNNRDRLIPILMMDGCTDPVPFSTENDHVNTDDEDLFARLAANGASYCLMNRISSDPDAFFYDEVMDEVTAYHGRIHTITLGVAVCHIAAEIFRQIMSIVRDHEQIKKENNTKEISMEPKEERNETETSLPTRESDRSAELPPKEDTNEYEQLSTEEIQHEEVEKNERDIREDGNDRAVDGDYGSDDQPARTDNDDHGADRSDERTDDEYHGSDDQPDRADDADPETGTLGRVARAVVSVGIGLSGLSGGVSSGDLHQPTTVGATVSDAERHAEQDAGTDRDRAEGVCERGDREDEEQKPERVTTKRDTKDHEDPVHVKQASSEDREMHRVLDTLSHTDPDDDFGMVCWPKPIILGNTHADAAMSTEISHEIVR